MIFGKAVSNVQATLDQQGNDLKAELERGTRRLETALIVVGGLAALALVIAVLSTSHQGVSPE